MATDGRSAALVAAGGWWAQSRARVGGRFASASQKLLHGSTPRPFSKLNDVQRAEIRRRYAVGDITQRKLAALFGVTKTTIFVITKQAIALSVAQETIR